MRKTLCVCVCVGAIICQSSEGALLFTVCAETNAIGLEEEVGEDYFRREQLLEQKQHSHWQRDINIITVGQRQTDKIGRRNNAAQKVVGATAATQSCSSSSASASAVSKLSIDENKSPLSTANG